MKQWSNLKLPLWTPDGHVGMLMLTAVTTTADVCNLVAYRCHLESNIGFALCLADQEKVAIYMDIRYRISRINQ